MKKSRLPPLKDKRLQARAKDRLPMIRDQGRPKLYADGKIEKIGAEVFAGLLPRTERLLEKLRA